MGQLNHKTTFFSQFKLGAQHETMSLADEKSVSSMHSSGKDSICLATMQEEKSSETS
jgi:hypothetical protein